MSSFPSEVTRTKLGPSSCGASTVALLGLGTGIVKGRDRAAFSTLPCGVARACCEITAGAQTTEKTMAEIAASLRTTLGERSLAWGALQKLTRAVYSRLGPLQRHRYSPKPTRRPKGDSMVFL